MAAKGDVKTVAVYDARTYDQVSFEETLEKMGCASNIRFVYIPRRLDANTINLAKGSDAVCLFVNDDASAPQLTKLSEMGIKMVALRCAGFDRVDLLALEDNGMSAARVPAYSPYSIAEHAWSLLMALNRKLRKAIQRTRDGNFQLDGLVGFDIHGKTVGVVGTGKIGQCFIDIALGFGCNILCYDVVQCAKYAGNPSVTYVPLEELLAGADLVTLHAPLLPSTVHMINRDTLELMKPTALLVNTSRGPLIHSRDLVDALLEGKIAGCAMDVYENETNYFFSDHSDDMIMDDTLARLLNMHNVIVTGHQAFLTKEALENIATTTIQNLREFLFEGKTGADLKNHLPAAR